MGSKPGQVPPEIWLEIAKHLSPRIIRHLASLSPTFASIAAAHKSNTIFVPTLPPILFGKGYVDMQNVACEIVQKLKRRIQSGGAVDTRHIIFYGPPRPESNESPTVFTNLSYSLGSRVRQILSLTWLPKLYTKFGAVDSLSILLNPDLHLSSPLACQCLCFSSVWETYSANLRELSISVAVREELAVFLPSQSAALSKLEVMRLSFIDRKGLSEDPRRYLKLAVPMYTNESLQELNLHIVYSTYSTLNPSSLAEILLPQDHTLPCLASFSFVTERSDYATDSSQMICIAAFIQRHVATLRNIRIHGFTNVFDHVFSNNAPPFPTQPSFSFAPANGELSVLSREAFHVVRDGLIEAELDCGVVPLQSVYPALRRLHIRIWDLDFASFDEIAKKLPDLLSLSISYRFLSITLDEVQKHLAEDAGTTSSLQFFKTLNPPISSLTSSLANWGLKDLTIVSNLAQGTSTVVIPNYRLMRDMAGFIPSIESFNGRGDMLEVEEPWESVWPWKRNAYIDRIWNDNAHN